MEAIKSSEVAADGHDREASVAAEAVSLSVRFAPGVSNLTATCSAAKTCAALNRSMGEAVEAVHSTGRKSTTVHAMLAHADTISAEGIA
jgi:hypothetical protein